MGNHRDPGTIDNITHGDDHGLITSWVIIHFDNGCSQGFGGLCLEEKTLKYFLRDLCKTFGVRKPWQLLGKKYIALRSFGGWNETIEGLETPKGKRFTITGFRKAYYPEHATSPLETRRAYLKLEIASWHRRIRDNETTLQNIDADFVDWEKKRKR